jgi:hypothetical protein
VFVGFAAFAVVWTLPLSLHLTTHLPGTAIGDNAIFLWNFWWMRHALAAHTSFFHTNYLFAPVGTSLTLHTHTALPAFAGATLLGALSPVAALNVVTLAAVALNGFAAYLLAWQTTRHRGAAIVGGVVFASSPFVAAHLTGHFNLVHAWTIPLFALAWLGTVEGSSRDAILAGVLLAATAYVDYYLVVYEISFAVCACAARAWRFRRADRSPGHLARWTLGSLAMLVALDLAVMAAIWMAGGFSWTMGSTVISAHDLFNPTQAFGVLIVAFACVYYRPRPVRVGQGFDAAALRVSVWTIGTFAVLAAPLAFAVARTITDGDYVSQRYFWRNAPPGIDLATLALGNPFHGVWGSMVRALDERLGIDVVESTAWLGIAPLILTIYAWRRGATETAVRQWRLVAIVFFVWALGSHLFIVGHNTALPAPAALLQFVPLLSNARMTGRAMVLVHLATAMLAAVAVAELHRRYRIGVLPALIAAAVIVESMAAPLPIAPIGCSSIYDALRRRPEPGAIVELPLGFGDGFGAVTSTENRSMLACQTVHERPLVGGFVARLSPRVLAAYRADPLLAAWLRLSGAAGFDDVPLPTREQAATLMGAANTAFIVVDRRSASKALQEYVATELAASKILEGDGRVVYVANRRAGD